MQIDWIRLIFQALFWIFFMTILMRWLGRQRLRLRPPSDAARLAQPRAILYLGLGCTLMFSAIWIASILMPDGTQGLHTHAIFIGFALLGLYLVADYFLVRHEVDEQGMAYGRLTGRPGRFAWVDVERVGFNTHMGWYRLELRNGTVVRVAGTMMGLPMFARHVLDHVPDHRFVPAALKMMEKAAQGELHKLWP